MGADGDGGCSRGSLGPAVLTDRPTAGRKQASKELLSEANGYRSCRAMAGSPASLGENRQNQVLFFQLLSSMGVRAVLPMVLPACAEMMGGQRSA